MIILDILGAAVVLIIFGFGAYGVQQYLNNKGKKNDNES